MGLFKVLEWLITGNTYTDDSAKMSQSRSYKDYEEYEEQEEPRQKSWISRKYEEAKEKQSKKSKCIFCGSTTYGSCLYSTVRSKHGIKVHVHQPNDEGRCVYCGKKSQGASCSFSPTGTHSSAPV